MDTTPDQHDQAPLTPEQMWARIDEIYAGREPRERIDAKQELLVREATRVFHLLLNPCSCPGHPGHLSAEDVPKIPSELRHRIEVFLHQAHLNLTADLDERRESIERRHGDLKAQMAQSLFGPSALDEPST